MSYYLSKGHSANYGGDITEHDYAIYANMKIRLNDLILNSGVRRNFMTILILRFNIQSVCAIK